MDILIVIGVAAMFAAMCVMYYEWRVEKRKHLASERVITQKDANIRNAELCIRAADLEISALRNDLHAAINSRKAKSRGITGKYRKAIEAHKEYALLNDCAGNAGDRDLWSVLDS